MVLEVRLGDNDGWHKARWTRRGTTRSSLFLRVEWDDEHEGLNMGNMGNGMCWCFMLHEAAEKTDACWNEGGRSGLG
jgi:hypothetical protein